MTRKSKAKANIKSVEKVENKNDVEENESIGETVKRSLGIKDVSDLITDSGYYNRSYLGGEYDFSLSGLTNYGDLTLGYTTKDGIIRVGDLLNFYRHRSAIFNDQYVLAEDINTVRKELKKVLDELDDVRASDSEKLEKIRRLEKDLNTKQSLNHILSRVSEEGRKKLLESEAFVDLFRNSNKCDSVVLSIDIRRSTELMLKARSPEQFSKFITELSFRLSAIITANFGIFDKFTGDGILAFFPKFYSSEKAIVWALKAANECHKQFLDHYSKSKDCFNVVIKDIGLGIGIDFGNVTIVNTPIELSVVGIPVVYACRFSGAKAGETLLNQPAKEEVQKICPEFATFNESEINIKNEGIALGYNVLLNDAAYKIDKPDWDVLIKKFKLSSESETKDIVK